jgi:hypothetical protein
VRRRRDEHDDEAVPENAEDRARTTADEICDRLESAYPPVGALLEDESFAAASDRLAARSVPFEVVERLSRSTTSVLAAMAHRAASLRDDTTDEWIDWAFRRLKSVYAGEAEFLLRAIERHVAPPLVPRVLASADKDWSEGWLLEVVTAFVERRVGAGERPSGADFAAAVGSDKVEDVGALIGRLDVLPAETVAEFERWRDERAQAAYFAQLGRVWDGGSRDPAVTTVGGRAAALEVLRGAVADGRSVLVVGEHGVGKSAVVYEALRSSSAASSSSRQALPMWWQATTGSASSRGGCTRSRSMRRKGCRSSGCCRRSRTPSGWASTHAARAACSTRSSRRSRRAGSSSSASSSRRHTSSCFSSDRRSALHSRRCGSSRSRRPRPSQWRATGATAATPTSTTRRSAARTTSPSTTSPG